MKNKKTIYKWLTNRFLLIIRNEENFAEKKSYSFNYAKLIVVSVTSLAVLLVACFFIVTTFLGKWFNPRIQQIEINKKVISLSSRVDSLMIEAERKDVFIKNIQKIITGEIAHYTEDSVEAGAPASFKEVNLNKKSSVDKELRSRFESGDYEVAYFERRHEGDPGTIFIKPVSGIPVEEYKNAESGVKIKVKKKEPVRAIAEGNVFFASWTMDNKYVIGVVHPNNYISFYKNANAILKEKGDPVASGEVIAWAGDGNAKETEQYIFFELWFEGKKVNPLEYLSY
ncbi:MAG: murein hydrolase activator EnvC family protein [Cytophagaceae bacterium]